MQPPEPTAVPLRLLAKSWLRMLLSRLDLLRLELLLGVLGDHDGDNCERRYGIEGRLRSVYTSQTISSGVQRGKQVEGLGNDSVEQRLVLMKKPGVVRRGV